VILILVSFPPSILVSFPPSATQVLIALYTRHIIRLRLTSSILYTCK